MKRFRLGLSSKKFAVLVSSFAFAAAAGYNGCSKVSFNEGLDATASEKAEAPIISINNGDPFTNSTDVRVGLNQAGAREMYITNAPGCLRDGAWETYAREKRWNLADKNQLTYVYVKFRGPNLSETHCFDASISHDDIPPIVIVTQPVPAQTNLNPVLSQFVASDSGSGVAQMLCVKPLDQSATPCPEGYLGQDVAEGSYSVKFLAVDRAGNVSPDLIQNFTVDRTYPWVVINSMPPLFSGSTTATFRFSATDQMTGIVEYRCDLDNQNQFKTCQSGEMFSGLANGKHQFAVVAIDGAGNSSSPAKYEWTVDTTAPKIEFVKTPGAIVAVASATFEFAGTESDGTPLSQFECRVDQEAFAACASPVNLRDVVEGSHSFAVRGISRAGIRSSDLVYKWLVDLTGPMVKVVSGPQVLTNSNLANFQFAVSDALSGVASVSCRLDGAAFSACSGALSATYMNIVPNLEHVFQVAAKDSAGNMTVSDSYKWYVDRTAPEVRIVSAPAAFTNATVAQFKFEGKDDHSASVNFLCRLDNEQVYAACPAMIEFPNLGDGAHALYVQSLDGAGNTSNAAVHNWTIQTTGPVIKFTKLPDATIFTTVEAQLAYEVTDSISKVKEIKCSLDATPLVCASVSATLTFPMLAEGAHKFELVATNEAGVSSMKSYEFMARAPVCTTTLSTTNIMTKMLFIVDMSGSNQSSTNCTLSSSCTDPGKKVRAGSLQAFFNDYGQRSNFQWSFSTFKVSSATALINAGSPWSPIFGPATSMQNAINTFSVMEDSGGTPYMAALNQATTAISFDPDLNSAAKPQYLVVFMSDGQPSDTSNYDLIRSTVKKIVNLAPGRITFNAVYYGPSNNVATNLMQSMALEGSGKFLNTNTDPAGLKFKITDAISLPITTCKLAY